MVIEPLPDVNASQLQMLKYMKRGPSSNSDSGSPASYGGKRMKKRECSCWFYSTSIGVFHKLGLRHLLTL